MEFQVEQAVEGLLQFINNSPTGFHAVDTVGKILEEAGFIRQNSEEYCNKELGDKSCVDSQAFYVVRNDSSLIAVKIPSKRPKGFRIMASHSDSPCFKIKEKPEIVVDSQYVKLNVEKYGGMILSTWLDRPLGIAGRVVLKEDGKFVSKLVDLDKACCVIPNLAIHFNREINKGFEYNPQIDMLPLFSENKEENLMQNIAALLGIQANEILGSDLYLYVRNSGCCTGINGEYIMAPRLDDLQCAYGTLRGFVSSQPQDYIAVYCLFDNEEVGSRTRQGADSDFLLHTLQNVWKIAGQKYDFETALTDSFLISADNAHALHPNHPEKSDLTNKPYLNKGIVLKFNGNAHYTTDGYSQAFIKDLCNQCNISIQTFFNRSDIPGGSTLGNIVMSHLSIPAVDIGLPQLAMHSAMETAGTKDVVDLMTLANTFWSF